MMMANRSGITPQDMAEPLRIQATAPPQIQTFLKVTDPVDLAVSSEGNVYELSSAGAAITELSSKGEAIRSVENIGVKPCGLDIDAKGNVYVALTGDNQVAKFKPTASSFELDASFNGTGKIGNPDQSAGKADRSFDAPYDVAVDQVEEVLYVSDTNNNRLVKYKLDGRFEHTIGGVGAELGQFDHPRGLCSGGPDWLTYVADTGNHRLVVIGNSFFRRAVGTAGSGEGQFDTVLNVAANRDGIYAVDAVNDRLQAFEASRESGEAGNPFIDFLWATDGKSGFHDVRAVACAPDPLGTTLYLVDAGNQRIASVKISRGDLPEEVWNQMKKHMAAHDVEGALTFFTEEGKEKYRRFFQSNGQENSAKFVGDAGKISVVSVDKDEAHYEMEQTLGGRKVSFPVYFVREGGRWKIEEF